MYRLGLIVFALFPVALHLPAHAQDENAVPKELVQYVRDAKKAGLNPTQIRQNAVKAGWPQPDVEKAIESAGGKAESKSATEEKTPAEPAARPAPESDPVSPPPAAEAPKTGIPPKDIPPKDNPSSPAGNPGAGADAAAVKPLSEGVRGDDYLIGEGDVLQIAVFGEPTASVPSVTVRTDGKISMPLLHEIHVAGMTPRQVEAAMQEQLSKLIRTPDVAVIVSQINSKKIYLTGAVKKEGPLKFTYRMTVLQAISEAGGLTDYAKRKNIYILHTDNGRTYKLPFNYLAVLKGEHMEQNILLSPGDTIVVP